MNILSLVEITFWISLVFVLWALLEPVRYLWFRVQTLWSTEGRGSHRNSPSASKALRRRIGLFYFPILGIAIAASIAADLVEFTVVPWAATGLEVALLFTLVAPFVLVPLSYVFEYYFDTSRRSNLVTFGTALLCALGLPYAINLLSGDLIMHPDRAPAYFWSITEDIGSKKHASNLQKDQIFIVRKEPGPCLTTHLSEDTSQTLQGLNELGRARLALWVDSFFEGATLGYASVFRCKLSPLEVHPNNQLLTFITQTFENISSLLGVSLLLGPYFIARKLILYGR